MSILARVIQPADAILRQNLPPEDRLDAERFKSFEALRHCLVPRMSALWSAVKVQHYRVEGLSVDHLTLYQSLPFRPHWPLSIQTLSVALLCLLRL
jgi:hypothetical protein